MTNIDDARDFMVMRGDETETWFTFLNTKNATTPNAQDLHEAARQAVEIFDQQWAEGETTQKLVDKLVELYELQEWEVHEGSLGGIQVDAINTELELRHDTSEFFTRYAAEHAHDDTPVAFSNKVFVTAWTDEILRKKKRQADAFKELLELDMEHPEYWEEE